MGYMLFNRIVKQFVIHIYSVRVNFKCTKVERIAVPVLSLSAGENKLNNMSCIVGQLFFPETFKKFKFLLCFIMGNKVPISDVLLVSMWVILLLSSLKLLIDGR